MEDKDIKALLKDEPVPVKVMTTDPFEFHPDHKVYLSSSKRPINRQDDQGIWKRFIKEDSGMGRSSSAKPNLSNPPASSLRPRTPGNVSSLTPDHRCNACWYTSAYRYQCERCGDECCTYCSEPGDLRVHDETGKRYCRICKIQLAQTNPKWSYLWIDPRNIKTHSITWTKAFLYAKAMERGDHFPPVKAARSVIGQLLAKNGAHRAHAACMAGVRLLIKVKEDRSSAPAPEFLRMRQLRNQANRKSKG